MPSYDQWFRRYALLKLMKNAGILSWTDSKQTDYFDFLTKIRNESSRNFEYQTRRHLPQISNEYWCVSCQQTEQWLWPLEDSTRQNFRRKSGNRLSFRRRKKDLV
jgi:hypothetical protein